MACCRCGVAETRSSLCSNVRKACKPIDWSIGLASADAPVYLSHTESLVSRGTCSVRAFEGHLGLLLPIKETDMIPAVKTARLPPRSLSSTTTAEKLDAFAVVLLGCTITTSSTGLPKTPNGDDCTLSPPSVPPWFRQHSSDTSKSRTKPWPSAATYKSVN
eukprot:1612983-Rhodomonas_salina.1